MKARGLRLPVVLVTGSGDVDAAVRLLKAGAADYVVKRPGYPDVLPAVIEGAHRWFRSADELRRTRIRILYAEHNPADVELTRRALAEQGSHFDLDVVPNGPDTLARLRTSAYDLLLLDYRLPELTGIEVLEALREADLRVPVIMVTGQGDEDTAVQAFKLGAADYIIKREGYLTKLPPVIENVLAQRRQAAENDALVVLNGFTRTIAVLRDPDEAAERVAQAAADLLRTDAGVLWLADGPAPRPAAWRGLAEAAVRALPVPAEGIGTITLGDESRPCVATALRSGDQVLGVLLAASLRPRAFGALEERLLRVLADHAAVAIENARLYRRLEAQLEELRRTQAQLLQTEKIAAMGQLLAGVAHELNNPLAVVIGQAALLKDARSLDEVAQRAPRLARAAERCARIVKNFLALARQHPPRADARGPESPRPGRPRTGRLSPAGRRRHGRSRARRAPAGYPGRSAPAPPGDREPGDERASRPA